MLNSTRMEQEQEASPIQIIDLEDENYVPAKLTPISCHGSSKINAISVEQYSETRDLQLSIMASLRHKSPPEFINLDDLDDCEEIEIISVNGKQPFSSPSILETGQSSKSRLKSPPPSQHRRRWKTFVCEICADEKQKAECFNIPGCFHFYCTECMISYVASKLQDNVTQIRCPVLNCCGLLEPENCRGILPLEVFERWGNALCECVLAASEKFYCPFKDCSALMLHDGSGKEITQSECPVCRRLFCAECKVPWHTDLGCKEFQELNKDERGREDIMMMNLAKNQKWKRCPKCKFYVERSMGCNYMKCRCGVAFCYNCGVINSQGCSGTTRMVIY